MTLPPKTLFKKSFIPTQLNPRQVHTIIQELSKQLNNKKKTPLGTHRNKGFNQTLSKELRLLKILF